MGVLLITPQLSAVLTVETVEICSTQDFLHFMVEKVIRVVNLGVVWFEPSSVTREPTEQTTTGNLVKNSKPIFIALQDEPTNPKNTNSIAKPIPVLKLSVYSVGGVVSVFGYRTQSII